MPSTAREYLQLIVQPTVADFVESPGDIRRGVLAAMVLNHMADHVALEGNSLTKRAQMSDLVTKTSNDFSLKCPEYQFIRDVADATKHAKLSVPNTGPREVSSSSQISATPGMFEAPFGEGVFAEAVEVLIELEDGREKPLLPAVLSVLAAWKDFIRFSE